MEVSEDETGKEYVEAAPKRNKRQKVETKEEGEARRKAKAERKREKREKKKAKAEKLKVKREAKKAAKLEADLEDVSIERRQVPKASPDADAVEQEPDSDAERMAHPVDDMEEVEINGLAGSDVSDDEHIDMAGLADDEPPAELAEAIAAGEDNEASSAPTSPQIDSPAFDVATNHSVASSSSSILPPPIDENAEPEPQPKQQAKQPEPNIDTSTTEPSKPSPISQPKHIPSGLSSPKLHLPNIDTAALQERLRARIEELRARRKADGPEGKPAKSRQELLDQRRKKEEQRKAHKKELRRKAKEDEARKQEERLRGSGSPLSTDIFEPRSPRPEQNNFSFSRLAFEDGTAADPSLSSLQDVRRRKGPQDPRGALQAAQNKEKRLSGLDAEKRADIAEKDLWLNAKKRAHGERVRDDTSLLKKALKRKEQGKNKSEKQWKEREDNVTKGKAMKQKKREANLNKRKEEKGGKKGKNKQKPSGGKAKGKAKGRPGFEGRFKA